MAFVILSTRALPRGGSSSLRCSCFWTARTSRCAARRLLRIPFSDSNSSSQDLANPKVGAVSPYAGFSLRRSGGALCAFKIQATVDLLNLTSLAYLSRSSGLQAEIKFSEVFWSNVKRVLRDEALLLKMDCRICCSRPVGKLPVEVSKPFSLYVTALCSHFTALCSSFTTLCSLFSALCRLRSNGLIGICGNLRCYYGLLNAIVSLID